MNQADLVIRNARIVDGTGAAEIRGDVAVKDGQIAAVGDVTQIDLDLSLIHI